MSTKETTSKIDESVLTLSKKLAASIEIAKDGTVKIEPDLYKNNLPEEVPLAVAEKLQDYNSTFFAASAHAFGDAALGHMKKHADTKVLSGSFDMLGKDTWSVGVERSKSFPNPKKPEESIVVYGAITGKLEVNEARMKAGQLKRVKEELGEAALKALAE